MAALSPLTQMMADMERLGAFGLGGSICIHEAKLAGQFRLCHYSGGNRIASRAASSPGLKEMIHERPASIAADLQRILAVATKPRDLAVSADAQPARTAGAGRWPLHGPEGAGLRG